MEDLSDRQKKILQTVIEDYIANAMPVGSRTISKNIALSSATIRNEMSDLEDMGYLEQPHTSAGRVPSQKAYRFYVDHMMQLSTLTLPEVEYIHSYFDKRIGETGAVLSEAARVISELTEYVSVVTPPKVTEVNVSSIQLMPVNAMTAMVVLLTDTGMIQNTPIVLPRKVSAEELANLSVLLNKMFAGKSVSEIQPGAQMLVENEMADQRQIFDAVCTVLAERLSRNDGKVVFDGASRLLGHQEFTDTARARDFLLLLEDNQRLGALVNDSEGGVSVHIGQEAGLGDVSIVTATYSAGDRTLGKIGVIGPTRMQYDKVVSVLEQMGKTLSHVFGDAAAWEDDSVEKG